MKFYKIEFIAGVYALEDPPEEFLYDFVKQSVEAFDFTVDNLHVYEVTPENPPAEPPVDENPVDE